MSIRLDILRKLMIDSSCDGVLISSAIMISYLTGFQGFSQFEREAFLCVTEKNCFLITSALYSDETKRLKGVRTMVKTYEHPTTEILADIIQNEKLQTIGFEAENLTVAEYAAFKKIKVHYKPINLRNLRTTKTKKEIESIRRATSVSHQALEKIISSFITGVTEKELVQKLEFEMKRLGVSSSFPTIVAFGENAAIPHHLSGDTKLKNDDMILIDFGVIYNGYCSDTTRTFLRGKVPKSWEKVYETVKESQELAVEFITRQLESTKEIRASEVDRIAREYIITSGYLTIPHSLGHGIGLQVHESPALSPFSNDILSEGMVFSIEPGIYLSGEMGVRIEDLFVINEGKLSQLAKSDNTMQSGY